MILIVNGSKFVVKPSATNKRLNDYLVSKGKYEVYMSSNEVKREILQGHIENAYINSKGIITRKTFKVNNITENNVDRFKVFIRSLLSSCEDDYEYSPSLYYSNLLSSSVKKLERTKIIYYGNEIVALIYVEDKRFKNNNVVYINYYSNVHLLEPLIMSLSTQIKNPIFDLEYTVRAKLSNTSLCKVNLVSNIAVGETKSYIIESNSILYVPKGRENCIVDLIESRYPDKIDVSKLTFKNVRGIKDSDISQKIIKMHHSQEPIFWQSLHNHVNFIGFHYFKFDDILDENKDFLFCFYGDVLVGLIKYGIWGKGLSRHQAIAYIDVHQKYRKCGIAKYMISHLNEVVYDDIPLVITDESELGKVCHMADKMKKAVTKVSVKTYHEAIRDGRYD